MTVNKSNKIPEYDFDQELSAFYKEQYLAEMERIDKVVDRLNLTLTQTTILGGILGYFVILIPEFKSFNFIDLAFYIPFALSCISFLCALGFVSYAGARGFKYKYIPTPDKIAAEVEKSKQENEKYSEKEQKDIRTSFMRHLTADYCNYASDNWKTNKKRHDKLTLSFQFLALSLAFVILALPGFLIVKSHSASKPIETKAISK